MTLSLTHSFVSSIQDASQSAAAGEVLPSHWNAQHTITCGASVLLGNPTGTAGGAQEITLDSTLAFSNGTLKVVSSDPITVGTTVVSGGTNTKVLFDNSGVLGEYTISGSGNVAMTTSPSFTTPALGTPSAGVLSSCTGYAQSSLTGLGTSVSTALGTNVGTAGCFVVNGGVLGTPSSGTLSSCSGLPISTGVSGLGTGVATMLATFSSANIAAACTDETGSGALVFATSPSFTTPVLGTPTSGNLVNCTGYTAANVASPAALTQVSDTNVTLTLGGTPASALLAAASITAGWSGTLAITRGGNGNAIGTAYALHAHCGGI